MSVHTNDGEYTATNVSLKDLLQDAYGIREDIIYNTPTWAGSARFDVQAKVIEADLKAIRAITTEDRRAMLQAVLIDRFHLKVHTEMRTLPLYELVVTKGGPKFNESSPADKDKRWHETTSGGMTIHNGQLAAHDVPLSRLIDVLANQLHRAVLDKTGLMGKYDLLLNWTRDEDTSPDASAPGLFAALEEQLGLKLQAAKGPVETLVVDGVEMPSEN